jgi:pentatricopeptide repeat protein
MHIESLLRATGSLPEGAHEAFVRSYASYGGDTDRASKCFDEFASAAQGPSEVSLVAMLSACVEAKNVALAEHIMGWARQESHFTPPVFAASVKVLASARQPERICALYEAAAAEGMRPDDALSGQLMKFAVQAGQLGLAHRLFNEARNPDSLNYMSLIRACGQDKNVPRALEMLQELSDRGAADTAPTIVRWTSAFPVATAQRQTLSSR